MHKAPAVEYPVGRSRAQAFGLLAFWLGAAAAQGAWLFEAELFEWRHWLGLATLGGAGVASLAAWRRAQVGTLRWDGLAWSWECAGARLVGVVVPQLDLQSVLLLDFRAHAGGRNCCWLVKTSDRLRCTALRRAVFARPAPEPSAQAVLDLEPSDPGRKV